MESVGAMFLMEFIPNDVFHFRYNAFLYRMENQLVSTIQIAILIFPSASTGEWLHFVLSFHIACEWTRLMDHF